MGKLNAGDCAAFLEEGRDTGEHCNVIVFPDSVITGGDTSARLHRGGFHHYQSSATHRAAAQVD